MSNIPISSLPLAISLDGSETVPIVQGGTTKRTTTAAIAALGGGGGGGTTATFVFATNESATYPNSRLLAAESGVTTVTDGGAASNITVGVATNGISNSKIRQGNALSVIGNATNALANVSDISAASDFQILRRSGTSVGFGAVDLSQSGAVGTSILPAANGGTAQATYATGDTLYASATNTLSKLTGNITTAKQYLSQTGSGAASAAPAWAAIAGADITGAALTKTDDTNVTLTLGGTPTTSLLRAASITAGWTGQLAVGRGGTGLASGTSGGILGFTGTTTLASSVLLTQNALVLGGGAAATPTPLASLGATTTVLHGNAAGAPSFGPVSLTADVSGVLPITNGGTGASTAATAQSSLGLRVRLTADITYAVSKTGSDSNSGIATSSATVSFTNGSPNIVWTAHGRSVGNNFTLSTTGALPTNFDSASLYYVKTVVDANTITASLTSGGTAVTAGSAGSGTQTAIVFSPFLTIQKAIDTIAFSIDHNGFASAAQVGGGSYAEALAVRAYIGRGTQGHFTPLIQGAASDHTLVKIVPPGSPSANCVIGVSASYCEWTFKNLEMDATGTIAALVDAGSWICFDGIVFGGTPTIKIQSEDFGIAEVQGNITDTVGGQAHFSVSNTGLFFYNGSIVTTLSGTPAYSVAFGIIVTGGTLVCGAATFTGTPGTTVKYLTDGTAILNFGGRDPNAVLPGTSNGVVFPPVSGKSTHGDSNYTILPTDLPFIQITAVLTAPRTWTLPLSASVAPGSIFSTGSPNCIGATNTLTLTIQGGDAMYGTGVSSNSIVLNSAAANATFRNDGAAGWYLLGKT